MGILMSMVRGSGRQAPSRSHRRGRRRPYPKQMQTYQERLASPVFGRSALISLQIEYWYTESDRQAPQRTFNAVGADLLTDEYDTPGVTGKLRFRTVGAGSLAVEQVHWERFAGSAEITSAISADPTPTDAISCTGVIGKLRFRTVGADPLTE